jgi:hypothetical protein
MTTAHIVVLNAYMRTFVVLSVSECIHESEVAFKKVCRYEISCHDVRISTDEFCSHLSQH